MSPLSKSYPSSSSAKTKNTMQHFTHIKHPLDLKLINSKSKPKDVEFNCDACNTWGSGNRYQCKICKFDLHRECATCPTDLSSHIHPNHQLKLLWETPERKFFKKASVAVHPPCNVCGEEVKGLFYECPIPSCYFVLHPLCSRFPPHMQHPIDPNHRLTFQLANNTMCTICTEVCTSWRYRCETCRIDIHLDCLPPLPSAPPPLPSAPPPPHQNQFHDHRPHDSSTKEKRPVDGSYHDDGYVYGVPSGSSPGTYNTPQNNHEDRNRRRGRKRRIFAVVAQVTVMAVVTAVVGPIAAFI